MDLIALWTGRVVMIAACVALVAILPQWFLEYPAKWFGYWPILRRVVFFMARRRWRRCSRWLGRKSR